MSDGSFKTKMGSGGTLQAVVSDGGSEKKRRKNRGPGWRARLRDAQTKKAEEARQKHELRKRLRRRDRVNVRGRGR